MRIALMTFALALAGIVHAGEHEPIKLTMAWNLSLNADGRVTQLEADKNPRTDNVPQIGERLEQAIRGWQFVPGKVDGQPEPTDTSLFLDLTLDVLDDNSVRIRVDNARTGPRRSSMKPPRYPHEALHHHQQGLVVVRARYDENGHVTSAEPETGAPQAATALTTSALEAVKHWTFTPEHVAGHGVAGIALIPFCYALGSRPKTPPACDAWTPPGARTALRDGESLGLDPVARLQTEVAGHAL